MTYTELCTLNFTDINSGPYTVQLGSQQVCYLVSERAYNPLKNPYILERFSLIPRCGQARENAWFTLFAHMCFTTTKFYSDRVHSVYTYTDDVTNLPCCTNMYQLVFCSREFYEFWWLGT